MIGCAALNHRPGTNTARGAPSKRATGTMWPKCGGQTVEDGNFSNIGRQGAHFVENAFPHDMGLSLLHLVVKVELELLGLRPMSAYHSTFYK